MAKKQTTKQTEAEFWGNHTELSWSDGDARRSAAQCANFEDVRKALASGYPCEVAPGFFTGAKRLELAKE